MAALAAEFEVRGIGGVTLGTEKLQLGAAFPAELHSRWVLKLAVSALHDFPREPVEGGLPGTQLHSDGTHHE